MTTTPILSRLRIITISCYWGRRTKTSLRITRSTRMEMTGVFLRVCRETRLWERRRNISAHIVRKDFPLPLKSSVTSDPTPMRGRSVVRCVLRNFLKMATSSFMSKGFTWVRINKIIAIINPKILCIKWLQIKVYAHKLHCVEFCLIRCLLLEKLCEQ